MKKILFVCTGNTCRSPMAMAVFNNMAKEKGLSNVVGISGGLMANGEPLSKNSQTALEKVGISLVNYKSKQVTYSMLESADLIIAMTENHKEMLVASGVEPEKIIVLNSGISDPFGGDLPLYERTLEQITIGLNSLFEEGVFGDI